MTALQIETTTRCTLKCPACSRTVFAKKFKKPYPHYDIDPDVLYKFLDCSQGRLISKLNLCGDYGDSIYYPRLFELIDKFRDSKSFSIYTNGSHRDEKFWNNLCSKLTPADTIIFGIDGLEDTNHLYRINSDWPSIMLGMDIVSKHGINLEWETNIFSFNYEQLDKIKRFAESKGSKFLSKITHRFGNESLRPPEQFIDTSSLYKSEYSKSTPNIIIEPACVDRYRNTISAQHYFWPCGWISSPNTLYKSKLWKERDKWSITNTTLDELQANALDPWIEYIKENMSTCDVLCKMRCRSEQVIKEIHYDI